MQEVRSVAPYLCCSRDTKRFGERETEKEKNLNCHCREKESCLRKTVKIAKVKASLFRQGGTDESPGKGGEKDSVRGRKKEEPLSSSFSLASPLPPPDFFYSSHFPATIIDDGYARADAFPFSSARRALPFRTRRARTRGRTRNVRHSDKHKRTTAGGRQADGQTSRQASKPRQDRVGR